MQRFVFFFALGAWAVIQGTAEEDFARIWPENAVVKFGGSFVLNCSSSCEAIGLETLFTKVSIGDGPNWKAFLLTNVSHWTAGPLCYANCDSGQHQSPKATITIYKPPENIELDPLPKMEVGKEYSVTCQVFRVAPIRNLIVTLWKGSEQLLVKTFENHAKPEDDNVVVTHLVTAQRNDHKEEVTCQATLDLSPRGPLLNYTSHSISLESFDFQGDPQLQAELFLEAGSEMKVTCDASGLSPPEEATFDLRFAGKALTFNTSVTGNDVSAQALVTSSLVGEHELICRVSLGPVSKDVKKTVNVFGVPELILQSDNSELVVNQMVNITCSAGGNVSRGLKMQIWNANQMLASSNHDPHLVQHAIITRKEDNGREIICQMILMVDGYAKERKTSQKLTVFYGPQMDNSSCPPTLNWKEGKWEPFTCSASGNPIPTVQCWKDGRSYILGVQQQVKREHNGTYYCNATNQYGSEIRNVTIHVETSQTNLFAIIMGTLAVLLFISSVGMVAFCNNRKKMRIYHLWRRQPPPSQATRTSNGQSCLKSTTIV